MDAPVSRRRLLHAGWSICSAPPEGGAAPPLEARWLPIREAATVAAALRERGEWSPDGAPVEFDRSDWWYRVRFERPEAARDTELVLRFDGLATIADVHLNGKPLLASDNMFVRHERDVTRLLVSGANELTLRFASLDARLARLRGRPRWRTPMVVQQQLRWVRTTLLGRTPGWSPPAAPVGPWRPVWLEERAPSDPRDLRLSAVVEGGVGVLRCRCEFAGQAAIDGASVEIEADGRVHAQALAAGGSGVFAGELRVPQPRLWWPHTHGEPALHAARLRVRAGGRETVHDLAPVGFRTLSVDTADGDFRVRVNGVPVFCRGACWTPLDVASLRSTPEECRTAVRQARDAGMNMLRVPGTNVYEEDHFYAACDELGVLVWQDFMFANMDYPQQDEAFLASVATEATQQLRRLEGHACIAVLCGNSEVEQQAAMWGASREHWPSPLFDHLLAELCAAQLPGTPYWPSSAHGGAFPHQADVGTTSYYGVGAYLRPLDDARRCGLRFATECLAFANIPQPSTLERLPGGGGAVRAHHPAWKARSPRDLGAGWDFDDVRDHYVKTLFGVDPQQLRATDHERYLLLGRLATAEAMTAAFSEWRRPASSCRGALVLFLRDLWAGAGWGVVDDAGVPKSCWHALRRVLQPLAVLITDEGGNGLYLHVVNERAAPRDVQLELSAWRDGDVRVAHATSELHVAGRGALTVPALELLPGFTDLSYTYRFGPMSCDAVVATLRDADGGTLAQAFHFPGGLDARPRVDAGLTARATTLEDGSTELVVRSQRLAQGVHFDIHGYTADDEYFHLMPRGEARVILRGAAGRTPAGWVHASNSVSSAAVEVDTAASRMKGRST
jgi:beta-mannosidase